MGTIYIGSARSDENKKYSGGKSGDQRQNASPDYSGEVSMQKFYVSSKGWVILRLKSVNHASKMADAMVQACNNKNIGYSQSDRLGVIKYGTNTNVPCNCDCSSLIRQCLKEATGVDAGNFTTANEKNILFKTGLFMNPMEYTVNTPIFNGDILVTKTKGHTVAVVWGNPRVTTNTKEIVYYPQYNGKSDSFSEALKSLGIDSSPANRKKIAMANGIDDYAFSAKDNIMMFSLLKKGKLVKP